jgi:hypothetical protein
MNRRSKLFTSGGLHKESSSRDVWQPTVLCAAVNAMDALNRRSCCSYPVAAVTALWLICSAVGCGQSNSTSVVGPSVSKCAISVTNNTPQVPATGGSGTLTVTAERECVWSARADAAWITLSGTAGQGPATLNYTATPNPNATQRRGHVMVSDQAIEIVQREAPCDYKVTPDRVDLDAAGGPLTITVTTLGACTWRARADVGWMVAAPAQGAGSGTIRLTVSPNTGAPRAGTVTIGGAAVVVHQTNPGAPPAPPPSCTYTVSPATRSVGSGPQDFTVTVTTQAACTWTASSEAAWITIAAGGTGTGNGTFRLTIAGNTGGSRTGVVRVGQQTVTVDQTGGTCTYTIKPTDYHAGRGPDDVRVSVSAPASCGWTATSPVGWVKVAAGGSGSGDGTVRLLIDANNGANRTADVTIAGETFRVRQNGCSTSIKPTDYHAGRGPDDITIAVTADQGCTWTAASTVGWVTVTQGQTGTGDGTVRLLVDANRDKDRSVTLSIAGQAFTLRQDGSK